MIFDFNIDFKIEGKKRLILQHKVNYILSKIHITQYENRSIVDRWVPLNIDTLRNVIGDDASLILHKLRKDGFIESYKDGLYKKNQYSRKYRINYDMVPKKGIKLYNNKYEDKAIKLITGMLESKMDYKTKYIIEETQRLFNTDIVKFDDNDKVYRIINSYKKENYDKFYCQKTLVDKIVNKGVNITIDSEGSRIYGNYSNLSKDVRKHLTIDGEYTSSIDIKNSQFQFLAFDLNKNNPLLKHNKKALHFFELVHNGKFYNYLLDELGPCKVESKSGFYSWKQLALNWLYAENVQCTSSKKLSGIEFIMKNRFTPIYNEIVKIRSKSNNGGSILARKMQKVESLIIKDIQYNLLKSGVNCLSIHDSIYVNISNRNLLNNVIDYLCGLGFISNGILIEDNVVEKKDKFYFSIENKKVIYDAYNEKSIIIKKEDISKENNNLIKNEKKYDDIIKNYDSYIEKMRKELIK